MFLKVPDYEFALVSAEGELRSSLTGYTYTPHTDRDGYLKCKIWDGSKNRGIFVHRAVAKAFIPNPQDLPVVNHKDFNKKNNSIENLEWCTVQQNNRHAYLAGVTGFRGEDSPVSRYTEEQVHLVCELLSKGITIPQISKITSIKRSSVFDIKSKKCWTHISKNYKIPLVKSRKKNINRVTFNDQSKDVGLK